MQLITIYRQKEPREPLAPEPNHRSPQAETPSRKPPHRRSYPSQTFENRGDEYNRLPLDYEPDIKLETILAFVHRHESLTIAGYECRNLPKYDDLSAYGIPELEERRLWQLEVERLLKAATCPEPFLFNSHGVFEDISQENFQKLSDVADQIACNLGILFHDNALISNSDKYKRNEMRFYKKAKQVMQRLSDDLQDGDEDTFKTKRPTLLTERNRDFYFVLIDYVTSTIARYLYRCAASTMWHNLCFATIAKFTAKLKILEKDPIKFASISLEAAEDLDDEKEQHEFLDFVDRGYRSLKEEAPFDPKSLYHLVETNFREALHYIFLHVFGGVLFSHDIKKRPDDIEICHRVYRTGQNSSHTVISSDKWGEFAAASDPKELRYSRAAFDILLTNCRIIKQHNRSNPPADASSLNVASVEWNWDVKSGDTARPTTLSHEPNGRLTVSSMDHAISLLVPLALCDAHASTESAILLIWANMHSQMLLDEMVEEYVDEDFISEFSFTTTAHNNTKQPMILTKGCRSLKEAGVLANCVLPGTKLADAGPLDRQHQFSPLKDDLEIFNQKMDIAATWKVHEKSVIVSCKTYVWSVLGISLILVLGGVAVPFTGRVHLSNVDPFNIATFVWLLVAFILLVAQSRYVPDWAWHDFLHRRIVCRSVTELSNVTGLDPQLVIHKLLIEERNTVLSTRGPFNSMFNRQSEEGFSIDVPCMTSTLYASGFVLFQCLGQVDRHIVCADLRPVSKILTASHVHKWEKCLGCPLPIDSSQEQGQLPVLRLVEEDFHGDRLLGLFLADRKFG